MEEVREQALGNMGKS